MNRQEVEANLLIKERFVLGILLAADFAALRARRSVDKNMVIEISNAERIVFLSIWNGLASAGMAKNATS
jgi:hypothetical protein